MDVDVSPFRLDGELLLREVERRKSVAFSDFAAVWKEFNFSLIFWYKTFVMLVYSWSRGSPASLFNIGLATALSSQRLAGAHVLA